MNNFEIVKRTKYLQFEKETIEGRKTPIYLVYNHDNACLLGEIKWYGPFRKFSFFPENDRVFEPTCLQDITDFVKNLMNERKK